MPLTGWAERVAARLLRNEPKRLAHVRGVATQAQRVGVVLPDPDRSCLVAAAYLHDVGYSADLHQTGAHQLDGATFLRALGQERLACLVAHHSEARFELGLKGLDRHLEQYPAEDSAVADALTYCDMTTGPDGERLTPDERIAEIERRYGSGLVIDALNLAKPLVMAAVERTEQRLQVNADGDAETG